MNLSTLLGFAIAVGVVWLGVIGHSTRPTIFLDAHALILVVGGTVAAGLIAFPFSKFVDLFAFFITGVLYPAKRARGKIVEEVLRLSGNPRPELFDEHVPYSCHPFLAEGYRLISKQKLTESEFRTVLQQRNQNFKDRYNSDAKTLTALAKFPPAFGLLGATTGMIAMMTNLGSSGQESIGPSMAIALVATFWGIGVANLVLLPLADHASKLAADDSQIRTMMMTGLMLLHRQDKPAVVLEVMIGYLPVRERSDPKWRKLQSLAEANIGQTKLESKVENSEANVIPLHDDVEISQRRASGSDV
jgi:chemotaxis protein MotA